MYCIAHKAGQEKTNHGQRRFRPCQAAWHGMEDYRAAADLPFAGLHREHRVAIVASSPQMQHGLLDPGLMLLSGLILLASILIASAFTLYWFEHRPLASLGVPLSGPWLQQTCIGLLVGSIPPVLFFLAACKLGDAHLARAPLDLHHVFTRTLPALGSILLLAFHEELLFRGYLMQLISQKAGRALAALITGILFGLVHSANSAANPQGLLFTAIGGVLLAWLIMRNGSLWMAGGYHAGWNATAALALGLSVSGTTTPGSWITTTGNC